MVEPNHNISQLTDHLFRHESGKMVAILTRIFGLPNIELAEDVVQDAFAKALKTWPYKMPANPAAWLMLTAKNKTIDVIRRERYQNKFAEETSALLKSEYTISPVVENLFLPEEIKDSQLRMIFACCHSSLSAGDQIAFTLKTCSGFSVYEIAKALISNPDTIKKRLQRARKFIIENNIRFYIPVGNELKVRLDAVLHSVYLLFNEGYNSANKDQLIQKDICEEALRLAVMLTEHPYTNLPKCFALVALMSLLASRFDSRLDENGEIILLEEQDRNKWDKNLINIGLDYLNRAASGPELSEYHIEAAIVAEHTRAKNFTSTNWSLILSLYDLLMNVNPSPVVLLNRAIILGKILGADEAIKAILCIPQLEKYMESDYLFSSVLGEMYRQAGNIRQAKTNFENAISLTNSEIEKKLIKKKLMLMNPE